MSEESELSRGWSVLGVPIDSVAAPDGGPRFGTELAPAALRDLGLVDRLGAHDGGDVDVRITGPLRDPVTGVVGGSTAAAAIAGIRVATADLLRTSARPLLLGGCCTQLVGAFPAAVDALGPIGLAYVDGHLDVYDHRTSPTGEVADMPVALLLGHGEPGLLAASGPSASLDVSRLRILGARDETEWTDVGPLALQLGLHRVGPLAIAADPTGFGCAVRDALQSRGFWLSLDLDVLDEAVFPATDYLMPGGLTLDQLHDLLVPLGRDDALVGASVACYNPAKDPDGRHGRQLVDLLVDVLGSPS